MFYPQKQLGATQSKFQQRIQEREKELQDLRQAVQSLKRSAQAAVEDSERIFTKLIRSIERRRTEVKELIRDQGKAEVSRAEGLLERLEQEIAELRRRDAELEQLSHTEDHIHFLQSCQSLCAPPEPRDLPSITVSPHNTFEAVRKSVSELKELLEYVLRSEFINVSEKVSKVNILGLDPKTREDFIQYSCQLTLDPNTAHQKLRLSEGNREVTRVEEDQSYPDHPERFDYWHQVLCREGLIGVYLDHRAGTLSFYSVSDTMTLLHRVQTTFTQPLCPGFGPHAGSSVKLCDLGLD
ncbi:hypothetical protein GJAV_G00084930 [Gymnothorax javanicus]|nr:hypothetical protein GJAV_G00084930 [Gymnothorax javanicus]